MFGGYVPIAFMAPGGSELIVVMLVLLIMFGAKDAPRILRKLYSMINQLRNTADSFKREVMYGDLDHKHSPSWHPDTTEELGGLDEGDDVDHHDGSDYDYSAETEPVAEATPKEDDDAR